MSDLSALNVKELKVLLKDKGLTVSGKKADLVDRLTQAAEKENAALADAAATLSVPDNPAASTSNGETLHQEADADAMSAGRAAGEDSAKGILEHELDPVSVQTDEGQHAVQASAPGGQLDSKALQQPDKDDGSKNLASSSVNVSDQQQQQATDAEAAATGDPSNPQPDVQATEQPQQGPPAPALLDPVAVAPDATAAPDLSASEVLSADVVVSEESPPALPAAEVPSAKAPAADESATNAAAADAPATDVAAKLDATLASDVPSSDIPVETPAADAPAAPEAQVHDGAASGSLAAEAAASEVPAGVTADTAEHNAMDVDPHTESAPAAAPLQESSDDVLSMGDSDEAESDAEGQALEQAPSSSPPPTRAKAPTAAAVSVGADAGDPASQKEAVAPQDALPPAPDKRPSKRVCAAASPLAQKAPRAETSSWAPPRTTSSDAGGDKDGAARKRKRAAIVFTDPRLPEVVEVPKKKKEKEVLHVVPPKGPTRALRISGLRRPLRESELVELLAETGTIKGFWLDGLKSFCYVLYDSVQQAQATLRACSGREWPPRCRSVMQPVYVSEKEASTIVRSGGNCVIRHGDKEGVALRASSREPHPRAGDRGGGSDHGGERGQASPQERVPVMEEDVEEVAEEGEEGNVIDLTDRAVAADGDGGPASKTQRVIQVDELFNLTKTLPALYWLPVPDEVIVAQQAAEAAKRRMREAKAATPKEAPGAEPADKSADKSAEKSVEKSAEKSVEKSVGREDEAMRSE